MVSPDAAPEKRVYTKHMLKNKKPAAKTKPTTTGGHPLTRRHLSVLYISLITLTAVMLFMGAYIKWLHDNIETNSYATSRQLIKDAIYDLYRPAIINPQDGKQYVYEANIRFPASDDGYNAFRYVYTPASDDAKTSIELTTLGTLNAGYNHFQSEQTEFKNLPTFQRCSRLFIVQFEPGVTIADNFKDIGTVPLADGRTAYLYRNNACDELYATMPINAATLEATLRQIQSY
jgi:hypothetical protein